MDERSSDEQMRRVHNILYCVRTQQMMQSAHDKKAKHDIHPSIHTLHHPFIHPSIHICIHWWYLFLDQLRIPPGLVRTAGPQRRQHWAAGQVCPRGLEQDALDRYLIANEQCWWWWWSVVVKCGSDEVQCSVVSYCKRTMCRCDL